MQLIWNLEDRSTPWVGDVRDIYEAYEEGSPQYWRNLWVGIFDTEAYKNLFTAPPVVTPSGQADRNHVRYNYTRAVVCLSYFAND